MSRSPFLRKLFIAQMREGNLRIPFIDCCQPAFASGLACVGHAPKLPQAPCSSPAPTLSWRLNFSQLGICGTRLPSRSAALNERVRHGCARIVSTCMEIVAGQQSQRDKHAYSNQTFIRAHAKHSACCPRTDTKLISRQHCGRSCRTGLCKSSLAAVAAWNSAARSATE